MKKILNFFVLLAISATLSLSFNACENYPEGVPSFYSSEYRIVNPWQVSKTLLNGEEITESEYVAFMPKSFFYIYADHILMVRAVYNGQIRESSFATWILDPKKKTLELNFTFLGHHYAFTADIKKLSRRELIIEFDDENGDHWRIQMYSQTAS